MNRIIRKLTLLIAASLAVAAECGPQQLSCTGCNAFHISNCFSGGGTNFFIYLDGINYSTIMCSIGNTSCGSFGSNCTRALMFVEGTCGGEDAATLASACCLNNYY